MIHVITNLIWLFMFNASCKNSMCLNCQYFVQWLCFSKKCIKLYLVIEEGISYARYLSSHFQVYMWMKNEKIYPQTEANHIQEIFMTAKTSWLRSGHAILCDWVIILKSMHRWWQVAKGVLNSYYDLDYIVLAFLFISK